LVISSDNLNLIKHIKLRTKQRPSD